MDKRPSEAALLDRFPADRRFGKEMQIVLDEAVAGVLGACLDDLDQPRLVGPRGGERPGEPYPDRDEQRQRQIALPAPPLTAPVQPPVKAGGGAIFLVFHATPPPPARAPPRSPASAPPGEDPVRPFDRHGAHHSSRRRSC